MASEDTHDAAADLTEQEAVSVAPAAEVTPPEDAPPGAAEAEPAPDQTDETPAETPGEAPADEPKAKPKRARKATAKSARPKKAKADDPEPQDAPAGALPPAVAQQGEPEAEAEPEETPDTADIGADLDPEGAEDAEPQPPAPPGLSLLFQAPDTSAVAPRRRRATAPAQQPKSADERDDSAPDTTEPEAASAVAAGPAPTAATDGEPAEGGLPNDSGTPGESPGDQGTEDDAAGGRRRRRGGRGRRGRGPADDAADDAAAEPGDGSGARDGDTGEGEPSETKDPAEGEGGDASGPSRRRRRRRRGGGSDGDGDDPPGTVTKVRTPRKERSEPTAVKGSTRLEAKKQRRREGREAGRRRTIITEAEFLARRESVERVMVVRGQGERTQIGVLEDGVLVEHYVSRETSTTMAGNVYLGRVQNVLPSMEAAFVDIGKGRNAVLYAGEVNWDAAGLEVNQAKRIENALSSGDTVLVQVTKDPIGHKGARLTSQISLPGRYLVYVPQGSMTGISRKLPDTERSRLKGILKEIVPESAGVIVRTAAEGASEDELRADVQRLAATWEKIEQKAKSASAKKASQGGAPRLMHGEPDLTVRVIRDIFTEDFTSLVVSGDQAWADISAYVEDVAPDLAPRLVRWTAEEDVFTHHRVSEQIAKAMDRKVWLPSGGSLVIDRTEAMTVIDVNTGKFVGSGGNLEETVTKNNIEAAEEIVRQLRLRDIGGIIVIDFIDMVLESNRDLIVRRLLECLGRDRTKHQVAEVTSLGLVQMTRKRVGSGLIEVFSEPCEHCSGRGLVVHSEPVDKGFGGGSGGDGNGSGGSGRRSRRGSGGGSGGGSGAQRQLEERKEPSGPTMAQIAAVAHAAAVKASQDEPHEIVSELDGDHSLDGDLVSDDPVPADPVADDPVASEPALVLGAQPTRSGGEADEPSEAPSQEPAAAHSGDS